MSAYYNENDKFAAAWLRELIKEGLIADGEVDERSIADVLSSDLYGFTQCHFFAGIGGWSLALRLAGWPDDRAVWTGSCPCQPWSVAGKGNGSDDPRDLWPAWFRLIDVCFPVVVFGEQIESPAGRAWFDRVSTWLEGVRYSVGAIDLPAACVGAPQARQRIWFVADADDAGRQRAIRARQPDASWQERQEARRQICAIRLWTLAARTSCGPQDSGAASWGIRRHGRLQGLRQCHRPASRASLYRSVHERARMITLRDYQVELRDKAREAIGRGVRRILVQSPTGSGKTALVAMMLKGAVERKKRAWFCVHRGELLEQSVRTFIESADIHTGIIAAGYPPTPQAPVQVCSVASLKRRAAKVQPPDMIVWDECHHTASSSWSAIAAMFPRAVHVGLTATPQRLDGRGLAPYFDELICGPSTADLITSGHLSPYTLYAPPAAVDFSKVHRVAGDFDKKEVAEEMDGSTVVGDAVSHYRQHCPDARALVFAWSLDASRRIADQFVAAGIEAAHIDGETPAFERAASMRGFRDGSIRVICNVDLFGEGLDCPSIDAVFLLRPTQSLGLYLQQVGRGLRPAPGKASVKIFDHVNNWERHGLPDDPREWTLEGREKRSRESVAMGRRCEQCFGVSPIGCTVCRYCGHVFPVQTREIEQVEGTLQTVSLEDIRAHREKWRAEIKKCVTMKDFKRVGRELGYKPGWAWHMTFRHTEQRRELGEEESWSQPR